MRILHCIPSVNPAAGGPIEGVIRIGGALSKLGHSVEIASLDDPSAEWVAGCPIAVHALGPGLGRYGYSRHLAPWLRAHRSEFDVVVVNGLWQYHGLAAQFVLRGTSTPYVVFTHGMLDPWFKHKFPLKHAKKWLYWPWAEYRLLRDARATIFTCDEERALARTSFWLYRCTEAVITYGTADPGVADQGERAEFFSRFPDLVGRRIILYLGRIHRKKGCDLLLEAFAGIAGADDSLRLVMAGPDATSWGDDLRALADKFAVSDRVVWAGPLHGTLKWGAFRAADAFILCSHQENFGIAVAEALACGVPVLISDKVNIWREIEKDGAGIVAPDTLEGARTLLQTWLSLPASDRAEMARRSRQTFLQRFDVCRTAESLITILREHCALQ